MGKVKEYYREEINQRQCDDPSIEYNMVYQFINRWTPSISKWFNKNYGTAKNRKPVYIKAEEVEYPF